MQARAADQGQHGIAVLILIIIAVIIIERRRRQRLAPAVRVEPVQAACLQNITDEPEDDRIGLPVSIGPVTATSISDISRGRLGIRPGPQIIAELLRDWVRGLIAVDPVAAVAGTGVEMVDWRVLRRVHLTALELIGKANVRHPGLGIRPQKGAALGIEDAGVVVRQWVRGLVVKFDFEVSTEGLADREGLLVGVVPLAAGGDIAVVERLD